jgi:hypothetical protein
MKLTATLLAIIVVGFYSCDNSRNKEKPEQEIPKALQEQSSNYSLSKRSYDDDLVESLYKELANNTPELKDLENEIKDWNGRNPDSLETFEKFDNKNNSYYNSAKSQYEAVKDSVLKVKVKSLVASSQTNYNNKVSGLSSLVAQLKSKEISLNDLHILLKIVKTLPLIEKYQKDNLPSGKPIESVIKDLEKIIFKTDSLSKK